MVRRNHLSALTATEIAVIVNWSAELAARVRKN
jgi:hypothetical protein